MWVLGTTEPETGVESSPNLQLAVGSEGLQWRTEPSNTAVHLSPSNTIHILLPDDLTAHLVIHKAELKTSLLRELMFLRNVCLKFRKIMPVISWTLLFIKLSTIRELHTPPPTLPTSVASVKLAKPLKKILMRLNKQKLCLRKTMEKIQNQEETAMNNNTCHQIKGVLCERKKKCVSFLLLFRQMEE